MKPGAFVVVEGIDGSGSTSIVAQLGAYFRGAGLAVHTTCEPSTGPVGNMIRQVLSHRLVVPGEGAPAAFGWATMALLFAADRLDHLQAEVTPRLARGELVISDRYDLSSLAYQSATAQKVETPAVDPNDPRQSASLLRAALRQTGGAGGAEPAVAWIRELNNQARRPDLTIVLDVSADVAAARRKIRGGNVELYEGTELQRRLAALYADAERLLPGDRIVHVDANAPFEKVLAASIKAVEAL